MAQIDPNVVWADSCCMLQMQADGTVRVIPFCKLYDAPVWIGIDMARGADGVVVHDDRVVPILDDFHLDDRPQVIDLARAAAVTYVHMSPRNRHERRAAAKGYV